jgi:hypothetical protein
MLAQSFLRQSLGLSHPEVKRNEKGDQFFQFQEGDLMRRYMLGIAFAITSFMPAIGLADDQQIADFIKSRLQAHQQQGSLRGFNVDMTVERGVVWFKGHVSNSDQEMLILQTAQQAGHLGVAKVVDDIEVVGSLRSLANTASAAPISEPNYLQTASYQQTTQQVPIAPVAPVQQPRYHLPQANSGIAAQSTGFSRPQDVVVDNSGAMPMAFAETNMRAPMMDAAGCGPTGSMPMGYGGTAMGSEAPNLPGYAWPGYAAHPNYGQVGYPRQYSPSAWPYIGPFYPYPQVPLGWRKVSLQWDDGWWWLDFHDKCGSNR